MSYQSPIEIIMSNMQMHMEGEICKAIQNIGINVDKDELLKALRYDRGQYQKGYADRDAEIIRCKDCKYAYLTSDGECKYCDLEKDDNGSLVERYRSWDWFCADGERK